MGDNCSLLTEESRAADEKNTWQVGKQQKERFLTTAVSDGSFCWKLQVCEDTKDMQSLKHSEL